MKSFRVFFSLILYLMISPCLFANGRAQSGFYIANRSGEDLFITVHYNFEGDVEKRLIERQTGMEPHQREWFRICVFSFIGKWEHETIDGKPFSVYRADPEGAKSSLDNAIVYIIVHDARGNVVLTEDDFAFDNWEPVFYGSDYLFPVTSEKVEAGRGKYEGIAIELKGFQIYNNSEQSLWISLRSAAIMGNRFDETRLSLPYLNTYTLCEAVVNGKYQPGGEEGPAVDFTARSPLETWRFFISALLVYDAEGNVILTGDDLRARSFGRGYYVSFLPRLEISPAMVEAGRKKYAGRVMELEP